MISFQIKVAELHINKWNFERDVFLYTTHYICESIGTHKFFDGKSKTVSLKFVTRTNTSHNYFKQAKLGRTQIVKIGKRILNYDLPTHIRPSYLWKLQKIIYHCCRQRCTGDVGNIKNQACTGTCYIIAFERGHVWFYTFESEETHIPEQCA